ncbi:DUF2278 family protein [Arthrobacter sp. ok362]|uniref:DUF2278 family protein n=1 Tax=Arthrobacter sp. ok362 TaxID=1761745 RepID=UPI00088F01D4|nr:DUF2278 family protein [Arthrobacter sp. ok362]SDL89807.1 Uncharacterized protein YukJ [Arthrobacter sp. ok362]
MPLQQYGVLAARAVGSRREGAADTPHYQIHLRDARGTDYRAAVNVKSQQAPSELLYLANDDFAHHILGLLPGAAAGWTPLPVGPGGPNLDFIRGNLFDPAALRLLPPDVIGPDNDLADLLDHYVQRAIANDQALLYVFGQRFGPEPGIPDKVFGFVPGNGVHDIHMNQGNSGAFTRDDGVWQDGGMLMHFPAESRWVGIFLAFQSQAWHTDDATGHTIPNTPPRPQPGAAAMRILAALVNPAGPAPEAESVLLINASPDPIDLAGWRLADRLINTCPVPSTSLGAGGTLRVPLGGGVQLGNNGGAITLLDAQGLKVDGVSYTGEQAGREGWTVVF